MHFSDGSTYQGEWYLGRAWGPGVFTSAKGEAHDGEWANDQKHGPGIYSTPLTGTSLTGNWKWGVQSGLGVEKNANGE